MNSHSMTVLKYVYDKKKVDLESIFSHFKFDIPKEILSTTIDELVHKKLIEREFEGSPYFIISDSGAQVIKENELQKENEIKHQLYLERQRMNPRMDNPSPVSNAANINKSPHWLQIIAWIVGILTFLFAIYKFIIERYYTEH